MEQRAATTPLQRTRFWLVLFSSAHVVPAAFISASVLLRQVCFGRPTLRFPCLFQSRACLFDVRCSSRSSCIIITIQRLDDAAILICYLYRSMASRAGFVSLGGVGGGRGWFGVFFLLLLVFLRISVPAMPFAGCRDTERRENINMTTTISPCKYGSFQHMLFSPSPPPPPPPLLPYLVTRFRHISDNVRVDIATAPGASEVL